MAGCSASSQRLNSERIEQRFGSYGVDVLHSDFDLRISSLYSLDAGEKICRTYAVVELLPPHAEYAREVQRVLSGESIGRVFKEGGWHIRKETLAVGEIAVTDPEQKITELMRLDAPVVLASQRYLFRVSRDGRTFDYAIITETHHPDYLDILDLESIVGDADGIQTWPAAKPCRPPICQ